MREELDYSEHGCRPSSARSDLATPQVKLSLLTSITVSAPFSKGHTSSILKSLITAYIKPIIEQIIIFSDQSSFISAHNGFEYLNAMLSRRHYTCDT